MNGQTVKPRLLIVAPYGIPLRDFVLNRELSTFVFTQCETDVLSPLSFAQPEQWGFSRHLHLSRPRGLRKIRYALASRILSTSFRSHYSRFYEDTGWSSSLSALMLHHEIGSSPCFNPARWKWLSRFPASGVVSAIGTNSILSGLTYGRLVREGNYDAVITTHPTEADSSLVTASANAAGVPTICVVGGSDNLHTGGPVIANPDMVVAWGPEQELAWNEHHVKLRPELRNTTVRRGGSLLHDQIVEAVNGNANNPNVEGVPDGRCLITFAAYVSSLDPGQVIVCRTILEQLAELKVDGHLLVRVRPGLDEQMWQRFASDNPGRVTIQIPKGAFFTKWGKQRPIDLKTEIHDRDEYIATLRRSSLVITAAFSTVYIDAYAAGTPAIAVGLTSPHAPTSILPDAYRLYESDLASLRRLDFVTTLDQLRGNIAKAFSTSEERSELLTRSKNVYDLQAGTPDGMAGHRVVTAISDALR